MAFLEEGINNHLYGIAKVKCNGLAERIDLKQLANKLMTADEGGVTIRDGQSTAVIICTSLIGYIFMTVLLVMTTLAIWDADCW